MTPYGYKIVQGKAVEDPEKAKLLVDFLNAYLSGLSVKEAKKASGIGLSVTGLLDYMRNGTYAGTDYYPPIVPKEIQARIQAELAARTHPGFSDLNPPIPVYTQFRLRQEVAEEMPPEEKAAWLYSLIEPA